MQGIVKIEGVAAPIAIANLDTDQIMPKQFLRGIDKSGLDKGVFYDLRYDPDGTPKSDFYGNQPEYAGASIVVASPNYGCGSSREHAVWGMMQYGIKAVVATSFGEIFYSNAINNLLLPAIVSDEVAETLMAYAQSGAKPVTIDIEAKTITTEEGVYPFTLQTRHQQMFLEGTDLIGSTLKDRALIEAFIERRREEAPWAVDLPAKRKMAN